MKLTVSVIELFLLDRNVYFYAIQYGTFDRKCSFCFLMQFIYSVLSRYSTYYNYSYQLNNIDRYIRVIWIWRKLVKNTNELFLRSSILIFFSLFRHLFKLDILLKITVLALFLPIQHFDDVDGQVSFACYLIVNKLFVLANGTRFILQITWSHVFRYQWIIVKRKKRWHAYGRS